MDSNKEAIIKELTSLEKNLDEIEEIPEILEKYLNDIARTGSVCLKWEQFKPLIKKKIEIVVTEFNETHPCINLNQPNVRPFDFEEVKRNILSGIDSFNGAPFTVQRICELLTNPYKHYKRADKFMKGLEKNVLVVSEEIFDLKPENGNSSFNTSYLNSTYTLQPPSTSDSINNNNQSSLLFNGFKDYSIENSYNQLLNNNCPNNIIQQPPPIQQLDSFTTVFVSQSQTTPLDEIVNIPIFDSTTNSTSITTLSLSSSVTITATDPSLECNGDQFGQFDNAANEKTIEQQSQITINAIETVNNEQQTEIVDNESIETNKVVVVQEDDRIAEESKPNVSVEIVHEQDDELNVSIEEEEEDAEQEEETIDNTPVKENKESKRLLESPDAESIKRFKSDNIDDCEKFTELDDSKEEPTLQTIESTEEKEDVITSEFNNETANQVVDQVDANEQNANDVESSLNQQDEQTNSENKCTESEESDSLENVKSLESIESTDSNNKTE